MLQELPGLKWDGQVVSRTIEYGQTVRFDQMEYVLGDSAFSTLAVMIPAFKKGHDSNLSEEKKIL